MAQGGTSPQRKGAPLGRSKFSRMAGFVMGLQSAMGPSGTAREPSRLGDTQLVDNSIMSDTPSPSPLDLGTSSYAAPAAQQEADDDAEDFSSLTRNLQEQQLRDRRMRETAEQFVGAPVVAAPSAFDANSAAQTSPSTSRSTSTQTTSSTEQESTTDTDEDAAETEADTVRQLHSAQVIAAAEQERQNIQRQQRIEKEEKAQAKARQEQLKKLWDFINGIDTITAIDVIGFIMLIIMMNLQMLNRLTFQKYEFIPKPGVLQMTCTGCLDCGLCSACLVNGLAFIPLIAAMTVMMMTVLKFQLIISSTLSQSSTQSAKKNTPISSSPPSDAADASGGNQVGGDQSGNEDNSNIRTQQQGF